MPIEREYFSSLHPKEYQIAGGVLRAFSDANENIVFVLDLMVDETKPNVLLVINADNNRKWDDILVNDYGMDLESIRPKKDNKYQKLDIEYSGLTLYQDLIQKYESGDDITDAIWTLNNFRQIAAKRAAQERLIAAENATENAQETIDKTDSTISELNMRMRQLRGKLADVRKNIGKEPTKHSAAKVLRIESQIDATNEKIRRAKKRLNNAKKRLVAATDDADAARIILERTNTTNENISLPANKADTTPAIMPNNDVAVMHDAPVPATYNDTYKTKETTNNTKAEEMADEEVKPLFDTDPEILDEEIAFKPIDFSAPIVAPDMTPAPHYEPSVPNVYDNAAAIEPLTFAPPVSSNTFITQDDVLPSQTDTPAPVLDSITAVETPTGMNIAEQESEFMPQHVIPSYAQPATEPAPMTDVAPAPMDSGFRPVSPLTGAAPVAKLTDTPRQKQSIVYYVMLVALIIMSVFVLWFYQKTTNDGAIPSIGGNVVPEVSQTESTPAPEPVVKEVVATEEVTPEPVVTEEPKPAEPVTEPEPMPEPVIIETEQKPVEPTEVIVPVSTSVLNTVPTFVPEPEVVKIETEEEILAKKPAYGVSQNEAMFIADENFETDRLGPAVIEDDVATIDMYDTPIVRPAEPAPVVDYNTPEIVQEYADEEGALICEGGASPDKFGCCPGESYTQIDNGGFVCCPDTGGDCFPPLF